MPTVQCWCPVLCLTQVFLFIVISLFILSLPLGDPLDCHAIKTDTTNDNHENSRPTCNYPENLPGKISRAVQEISKTVGNVLHQAKLMVYTTLSKYDTHDYYSVGFCNVYDEIEIGATDMKNNNNNEKLQETINNKHQIERIDITPQRDAVPREDIKIKSEPVNKHEEEIEILREPDLRNDETQKSETFIGNCQMKHKWNETDIKTVCRCHAKKRETPTILEED